MLQDATPLVDPGGLSLMVVPDRDRAMTSLLKLFGEAQSRKEYLDGVARLLQDWSGCRYVGIRVLDREGNVPFESWLGYSDEFWKSESWLSVNSDQCICTRVIRGAAEPQDMTAMTAGGSFRCGQTMDFVSALTTTQVARYRGVCMKTGFTSLAVVPVTYQGQILGAIHMADKREQRVPQPVVQFVEMVAPLVGEAVHRFSLEDELRRNHDTQSAINSLLRLSLEDASLEEILGRARDSISSIPWLAFEPGCTIWLLNGQDIPPSVRTGHYQVPIRSGARVLGYIDLQLKDRARRRREEEVVEAIADVLAGIVIRKQAEEQLIRAQRLEMAGRVAGQVAHDLNNLLSPLIGYPQLIKRLLPPDHPAVKHCDAQIKVAKQMASINEDLLTLGRRGRLQQQPTDLNSLVEVAASQLEELSPSVELRLELAGGLPKTSAAPAQLLRVIMNLMSNAREAMEPGGVLTVRTDGVRLEEPFGRYLLVPPGNYVRLAVIDTGSGIPPQIVSNIFDPFFTTKQTGKKTGSGLGLSVVQAIVHDHGGHVDLESEVNKGTTFYVYLPARQEP